MTDHNKQLAAILHDLGSMYRYLGGENLFKAIAYMKASQAIKGLPGDISVYLKDGTVRDIPGVGESLEKDIREFTSTGTVTRFENLIKIVPHGLMELIDISGFGPQSLKRLHQDLHIETKEEVVKALEDGRIGQLKGFGPKKVENMLRGLKLHKHVEERMLLCDALEVSEKLLTLLKALPEVKRVELAGSLRRKKETIGDLDILAAVNIKDRKKVIAVFTDSKLAQKVLAKGDTRVSIIMKENAKQADLRMVDESEWGAALQYFTGSKDHNIHLRGIARDKGYKISEYGIFNIHNHKRIAGKTEEELYSQLGMQYIPPEMREDNGEIELALKGKIPKLVELRDIKGDLHMHSDWSDGLQTMDELVDFVKKNFSYDYIAVTDHTKSSRIARGMEDKEFLEQIEAVKVINHKLGNDFLKAGAEVDILADGSLDLADEVLLQLDWVVASIHSGFSRNNTDRLVKACENPYVNCIGHPTGRLIGKREPYPVDIAALIKAAAATSTALEINGQPDRLDLNDELASEARKAGVNLVINTDSHKYNDCSFMSLGVDIARRAWCTADNILNTKPWYEIEKLTSKKKLSFA
ncbi:DNA polymerase X family [Fulvivirga imtechensis AK7]|uniref:DNA-directed DNA polymerase n=1 Tax=Fulvivirga imtechensis AK7 TaxID=1237149 RepID=L8JTN9_9BACT|nr:DNA polymerase/3'-5' exonuclease PolX [Fulvivirga imtechensis]ELR71608.1 DNA polymerase X family [Fulvivirga imtechensis AK7]